MSEILLQEIWSYCRFSFLVSGFSLDAPLRSRLCLQYNAGAADCVIPCVDVSAQRLKLCLILLVCEVPKLFAQVAPVKEPATVPSQTEQLPGSIEGTVLSDTSGQPLRRAQVLLRPVEAGKPPFVQYTNGRRRSSCPKVADGRYSLTTHRHGYLPLFARRVRAPKPPPLLF